MQSRTNNFLVRYSSVPAVIAALCIGLFAWKRLWIFWFVASWAIVAVYFMFFFFGWFVRYLTWMSNQGTRDVLWPFADCYLVHKFFLIEDKLRQDNRLDPGAP